MFTRVSIPTPFQVGAVNAYVAGRTVVDPGPDSEEAWSRLLETLEARELTPADVSQVLVTHPHPDHFGLAARLRSEGARVIASPDAAGIMHDFATRLKYEQSYFSDFFERCGISRETAEAVTQLPEAFLAYAQSVATDREVTAGDTLTVDDERLTVDSVAGHAVGELIFSYDWDGRREAIVGDNVLGDITPNPFLQPPEDRGGQRPRVLPAFNESLRWLREQGHDRFLTGHREPVESPTERIDAILAEHDQRSEEVTDIVSEGATTPADVMTALFGDLPATEYFSGMSEAIGHLDVLEAQGRVEKRESGGVFVYELQ
ncbi:MULTISPECIES: MBL fold metallo-hydrolase [Haloarcula]|uniref:Putative metallo-hydrolase YqjP n=1 Tax=Haloarcula pellucida TaxID=1427151 RepID=A0A830GQR4_9EURY|nr:MULTISPECIES: MBL fold metallo-hydrolase [Halomicroarcula]MBX0348105.1 MBL fold metallo-hydrolase [Halomicroarcula pellucida]MDS0277950.1 MBL fold metallo-hydrolase [Halomicroarcula sp. S1AR25-4]GGN96947.1 putative metallo-hydrolase YqjP [Halomicroarcula pellucida]